VIRDLEAVLLTVVDPDSKVLLRDAIQSYSGGSYRAAVVMALASGMDDLRRKLRDLARSGGAPQAVRDAHNSIDQLFRDQKAFESDLIDACETKAGFLSPSEAKKLRLSLSLRHLCAHASGHRATAEEARETICTMADLILSRPALMGMVAVDGLVDRVEGPAFFPGGPGGTQPTVAAELAQIHPTFLRALSTRLFDRLKAVAIRDQALPPFQRLAPTVARENLRQFIAGMSRNGGDARAALWTYIGRIVEQAEAFEDVVFLLSQDPDGISLCSPLDRDRCVAIVRRHLKSSPARMAIKHWFERGHLSEEERKEIGEIAESTLGADADGVFDLGWESLIATFFERLVQGAGSNTFDVANPAIVIVQRLDETQAARMTPNQRIRYLQRVASHKGRGYAANRASDLLSGGLGARAGFIDDLMTKISETPDDVRAMETNWHGLALLAEKSGRMDAVGALVDLFAGHEQEEHEGIDGMLKMAAACSDAGIAKRATAGLARRVAAMSATA
jgi:hypothetical protein